MNRQEFEFKAAQVRKDMLDVLMKAMSGQIGKTIMKKVPTSDPKKIFEILVKFVMDKNNESMLKTLPIQMTKSTDTMMYKLVTLIEKELGIEWKD